MHPHWVILAAFTIALVQPQLAIAQTLKIASPQRGSWESAIPELGQKNGIFKKHGIELDITSTSGGGETLQLVISGAVDIGLSAGTSGALGAYSRGAPIRIIGASSTGSQELFWYVPASSPIKTIREANTSTIAYSTTGASTQIAVLRFIAQYGLKAKPVATGNPNLTFTQVKSGQVDVGWSVAPFQLDALERGEVRLVARASDIPEIRSQTVRVMIANAKLVDEKKDVLGRFMKAYRETIDWLYQSPEAIPQYMAFSGFSEPAVKRMLKEFIPKQSLQPDSIEGLEEAQQDAIQYKFISAKLNEQQVKTLVQIPPRAP
jgi:NitT/TauT family transport system substrate-binding protein